MFNPRAIYRFFVIFFICIFFFKKNAYAYIDPGSGSYIMQVLIGVVMGGMIAIKVFWKSIKDFFKNHLNSRKK